MFIKHACGELYKVTITSFIKVYKKMIILTCFLLSPGPYDGRAFHRFLHVASLVVFNVFNTKIF